MKVNFNPIQTNQNKINNKTFKSNITFDIGGSQREGSCKIYYATTSTDEEIHREHTTVNALGRKNFQDPEDFINNIVNKISKIQKEGRREIKEKGFPAKENTIRNVAIFLPSYTMGDKAFYLPNIRNKEDRPLKDLDFSNFKERLKTANVDVSDDMNFKVLQDAMGTGLAMTQRLYDLGMLEEGSLYTACITGGGCGISNIEVVDKDHVIVKSSGSGYLSQSLSLQKVSRAGASAPALIENFCKAMGFHEELTADIKACHKAEFVLSEYATYSKDDPKALKLRELLDSTGMFEILDNEEDNEFRVRIMDEYHDKYNTARENAIDKYCLALARLAIIKKNEGSNGMIVTGTVAKAVNKAANVEYHKSLSKWVMQHLMQSFNSYELDKLQEVYDFKVFCDPRFFIDNNTECGELVHLAKFVGDKRRNWLRLNINDLKRGSKQITKKLAR